MIYNFLTVDPQVFWQLIILGKCRQIAIFIGGKNPFEYGLLVSAHTLDYLIDEFFMMDKVRAPQMKNARFVPVDEVMDLLGEPIIIGNVDDEIGKHLNRLLVLQLGFDFLDPGRCISKDHGYPKYGGLVLGHAHQHVFNLDFESPVDAFRQRFVKLVGRKFAVCIKNIRG